MTAHAHFLQVLGYKVTVSADLAGDTYTGERLAADLDEAITILLDAADHGAEHARIEITRPAARKMEDVHLPLADDDSEPQADAAGFRAAMADWDRYRDQYPDEVT